MQLLHFNWGNLPDYHDRSTHQYYKNATWRGGMGCWVPEVARQNDRTQETVSPLPRWRSTKAWARIICPQRSIQPQPWSELGPWPPAVSNTITAHLTHLRYLHLSCTFPSAHTCSLNTVTSINHQALHTNITALYVSGLSTSMPLLGCWKFHTSHFCSTEIHNNDFHCQHMPVYTIQTCNTNANLSTHFKAASCVHYADCSIICKPCAPAYTWATC